MIDILRRRNSQSKHSNCYRYFGASEPQGFETLGGLEVTCQEIWTLPDGVTRRAASPLSLALNHGVLLFRCLKCCRSLPIPSVLKMGASHYNIHMDAGLLHRTKEPALQTFNMIELRRIQVLLSHENMKARRLGHSWFILVLDLPVDCELWCDFLCIPPNLRVSSIHSSFAMPRERGKPRRGSAWHTHVVQR
jgi:hypothetical protein